MSQLPSKTLQQLQAQSHARHKGNPKHKIYHPACRVKVPKRHKSRKRTKHCKNASRLLSKLTAVGLSLQKLQGVPPKPAAAQKPENTSQLKSSNMSEVQKMPLHVPHSGPTRKIDRVPILPEEKKKSFERPKAVYDNHKSYYGIYADIQRESLKKSG